uniref:Protoporphyrinogen oxidase n=1 Tax=Endotrypanum schaudinni TaxID=5704 RepID=G1C9P3_9TRYP|nr:protoporphyrinogen oxidase [Endotrypanum schaudinni]
MKPQCPKYLLLYSTSDGHTKTIINLIAKQLSDETNAQCDVVDIKDSRVCVLSDYEKVLIGASIRYGKFSTAFVEYVEQHADELNSIPSAFFSVNLTARKEAKRTAATNPYTRKFLSRSSWFPQLVSVFAGALWYPRYNLFDRLFIKFIMKVTGGETDTTKEVVYTDWDAVRRFASEFINLPLTVQPRAKPVVSKKHSWISRRSAVSILALALASVFFLTQPWRKLVNAMRR